MSVYKMYDKWDIKIEDSDKINKIFIIKMISSAWIYAGIPATR